MLPQSLLVFVLALGLGASAASSSSSHISSSSGKANSASSASASNSIGTPSNTAALPSLSGVSSCVTNCLAVAASADGCESVVAVDCFCPNPKNYTSSLLSCLATSGCSATSDVPSAESLVEQFCAAASKPTSLSFASFTPLPSSASASLSGSVSGSVSGSNSASVTAPISSAPSGSTSGNAALAMRARTGGGLPLLQLGVSALGVLLGALVVL